MDINQSAQISRRTFLAALGTGAAMTVSSSFVPAEAFAPLRPRHFVLREDRFGRIFPDLPPFFTSVTDELKAAMDEIGKPGGLLDAKDNLLAGPAELIVDPDLSENNPNNPTHTAGTTFMGQFMDHDMTFDLSSRLGVPTEPGASANSRTPAFDLDSVYGAGPYGPDAVFFVAERGRRGRAIKFKVESGGSFEDVPRDADAKAIISDPRNDENLLISGLQVAFFKFHNNAVDFVEQNEHEHDDDEIFRRARRLTTWHYQWMIVHEFLPLFIGQETLGDILRGGRKFYRPHVAQIPVEFQGAAYRFGHSMVRPSYRANLAGENGQPFFGMIFDSAAEGQADPVDLRGGARARRRFVGWQTFFNFGSSPRPSGTGTLGEDVKPNKRIDTKISTPLFNLPLGAITSNQPPTALPQRNLLRQITWSLPAGQKVAETMGVDSLTPDHFDELKPFKLNLRESTPLWYYILKEAEVMADGLHLGPVGGRIVGEVILGLLQLDRDSYLWSPGWRPTLPTTSQTPTGDFRMIDFLTFAGVDPTSRGQ
jgi:hypothetical protein